MEFKSNHLEPKVLGEYISALSNGACLEHVDYGYLFFGVEDKTLIVKGTTYNPEKVTVNQGQSFGVVPSIVCFSENQFCY